MNFNLTTFLLVVVLLVALLLASLLGTQEDQNAIRMSICTLLECSDFCPTV
ncbi:hypothetical protein J2S09_004397 [Bacillus fengqiuensis]|nr:hypothetical protein [Bacillus fengqiuensis]